jgi:hypothetical protein
MGRRMKDQAQWRWVREGGQRFYRRRYRIRDIAREWFWAVVWDLAECLNRKGPR